MAAALISTQIEIDAPASRVWDVLANFADYPIWNPFIVKIEGEPVVDARLRTKVQPRRSTPLTFHPVVLVAEPNREFRWLGWFLTRGLIDGEHSFVIEALGENRCRLLHDEIFRGALVSVVFPIIEKRTREGFEAMNAACKARAEHAGSVTQSKL